MAQKCILIIEDSASQAMDKMLLLEQTGVETRWARNGWEGLEMAQTLLPSAIILDIQMPEIDGFEVCRQLKSNPLTARIPVIMNTVRDYAPDLLLSFDIGAIDFVPKDGFSGPVLVATLRQLGVINPPASQPGTESDSSFSGSTDDGR